MTFNCNSCNGSRLCIVCCTDLGCEDCPPQPVTAWDDLPTVADTDAAPETHTPTRDDLAAEGHAATEQRNDR